LTRPIALANAKSGNGSADPELEQWCARLGIDLRDIGDDLEAALEKAAAEDVPFVAVVGGDGTQRTAARIFAERGVTMLPVPGGTRNHFAKALGLSDLDVAATAVESGSSRDIPLADLNGETFVNTAVIGWYPEMVRTRERLRTRLPRPVAAMVAFARHIGRMFPFEVELAGERHRAWMLWVGNGRFGLEPGELAERDDVTEQVLDVRVALADKKFPRTRVLWDLVRRRLADSDHLERFVAAGPVTASLHGTHVAAALDAEVVDITTPLVFTPAANHVRVLAAAPPAAT